MKIEPQDYLQKLAKVYQAQCNQFLQERVILQAQLDLVLQKVEELETKITELDQKKKEKLNVNQNTDT